MTRLGIGLYESPTGALLIDLAARAVGHRFGTDQHGFATFACFYPCTLQEAFWLYDRPGVPHVAVTGCGLVVWEGRLEDVAIVDGGVRLTALGYWQALSDVPYTALWSTTRLDGFVPTVVTGWSPQKYQMDQNERLFIGLRKNETYGNTTNIGSWLFRAPHRGERKIQHVSMTLSYVLPANWVLRFTAWNDGFADAQNSFIDTNGGSGSGTFTWDLSATPRDWVAIDIVNNTGGNYNYTGETGANHVTVTALRIKSTTSSDVYADEIAGALADYVNGINSSQLSAGGALIQSPGVDLQDEIYEDEYPADILRRLAGLGDSSDVLYETGVWENRALSFQPRGDTARSWYVDASSLDVERTLETLRNSAYAVYQEEGGRSLRTAASADSFSVARYGLTRRRGVRTNTTDATQAGSHRDAALADGRDPAPRAGLVFREIYDAAGIRWPLWVPRAWDRFVIRNLPPTLSIDIDRIRTFRLAETAYDVQADRLTVMPEQPQPALDVLVAGLERG